MPDDASQHADVSALLLSCAADLNCDTRSLFLICEKNYTLEHISHSSDAFLFKNQLIFDDARETLMKREIFLHNHVMNVGLRKMWI